MKNKIADLLASFEFWYAKRFIQLDKHYTFFFDLNGDIVTGKQIGRAHV